MATEPPPPPSRRPGLRKLLRAELRHLTTVHPSDRLWLMSLAAALATGLPLLIGAYLGRMDYGLVGSLGGLVFLYLPNTPMYHRMVSVMACAFARIAPLKTSRGWTSAAFKVPMATVSIAVTKWLESR